MSPSEIRFFTASEDLAAVIDKGAELDGQIKKLTKEDKNIKSKIIDSFKSDIRDDEVSVRVQGNESVVVLTASESMSIDNGAEKFPVLREAIDKGFLQTVIEEKIELIVPPDAVHKAAEILKDAGIEATVTHSISVKASDVRKMRESEPASFEDSQARTAMESCLSVKTTHRVKYEK